MNNKRRHVLSVDDLTNDDVGRLFFAARSSEYRSLNNLVLMTIFLEPSTRTRLSFEMAAARLSMKTLTFFSGVSSLLKGESIDDTLANLVALGPDICVLRAPQQLDRDRVGKFSCGIINGGDGIHEHPSQALLDCFTLIDHFRCDDLGGRKILIIGDSAHSRVAHSNIKLMTRLGASVDLLGPPSLLLRDSIGQNACFDHFDDVHESYDAVMTLRIQKERLDQDELIHDGEYFLRYGLTLDRFTRLGDNCVLLHPGPINVGIELDTTLMQHGRSLILSQVAHGVAVRRALLNFIAKEA